ncbi:hypothetical protein B566_EDAN015391 [Ephemera danica]|nr:hypothetical protein B566_EDAN015391 [Ephemera danica]
MLCSSQLSEAEEEFKLVLKGCPDYVPALKGLGETYLCQAKDYQTRQLNGRCRDKCEDALTILTRAAKLQLNLACVWKLMGDACILPCDLGEHSHLQVCSSLLGAKAEEQRQTKVDCTQLLQLAARCYCRAISLDKEDSLVWHDLAVSYLTQARHSSAPEELLRKALSAAQQACQLAAANTSHWNLLGVIAAHSGLKQYKLAQHAFIRAIQVSSGNVQAWSNLGTLYLCLGDVKLAHQAYTAAQRTEPSFVECWIGQALVAESMGYDDAMDLFRHCTQLSTHPESSLGYAHWVCSSFPKQKESYAWRQALAAVSDELIWYTGRKSHNSCAYNLLGLVLERQGLLRGAAVAFEKAFEVALKSGGVSADLPRTNLARVLSSLGRNAEAVEHLKVLSEPSFHSQCLLALAYFKDGKFQESFTAYDSAWHWLAEDDAQKSHILVAKAAMAYMFQGSEGAKSLLFQCASLKPVSVQGLFSTCAIGMLHKDLQLSKLVLKELQPYVDDTRYMADIALFQAYTHFLQRQWPESIRGLSKVVHRHPDQAALWLALAVLLLNMYPDAPAKSSAPCAGAALCLGRNTMDISKVQSLVTLSHLQASNARKSLIEAQRAVHLYPEQAEGWAVLVAAVLPRCIAQESGT